MKTETIDFDLHGIVGIRLLNATPGDIAAVKRQIGPIQKTLSRPPEIIIRFSDELTYSSPIHYLGVDDVGFTDDAFIVLRGKQKTHVKTEIPFHQIGLEQCQIVCESGLPAVPLLMPIINLTALSKGALPLHATAFNYNGKGILVTGWSKGGKTEMLLAYAAHGAEYIGDEWIYLSQDGQCMFGIPEPIRIWHWHLQAMPRYKAKVQQSTLIWLQALNFLVNSLEKLSGAGGKPAAKLSRITGRITSVLKQQLYVQVPPEKLFGRMANESVGSPEKIFFVGNHADSRITVQPMDTEEIAERMVFSLQEERKDFLSYYLKYRFAFPNRHNTFLDQLEDVQFKLLRQVLSGKDAYALYHPYPVEIPSLFEISHPYC